MQIYIYIFSLNEINSLIDRQISIQIILKKNQNFLQKIKL